MTFLLVASMLLYKDTLPSGSLDQSHLKGLCEVCCVAQNKLGTIMTNISHESPQWLFVSSQYTLDILFPPLQFAEHLFYKEYHL